jgi:disulfide bond formation protein DsbB
MTTFIQSHATSIISFFTLISNIIFIVVLLVIIAHTDTRKHLYNFVHKYILELLFVGILAAVVGSLVYSNLVGFPPCDLCWWQRIFMYPQLIIVAMAWRKKDTTILDYLVPLSVIGALIALYQSFIQWGFSFGIAGGCAAAGGECAKVYFTQYGYITIPVMSLTVFIYILSLKFVYYHKSWKLKNGRE